MEDGSGVRTRTWTVRRPPLSPPAGVAPFAGVGYPYSQPPWAASLRPRKPLARGPSPRNPHVRRLVAAVPGCFTGSVSQIQTVADPSGWVTNGLHAAAGPLLAEPFNAELRLWRRQSGARGPADTPGTGSAASAGSGLVAVASAAAASGAPASRVSSSRTAPSLASGSLPVPHFGDCTQDGHPAWHSQLMIASAVARSHACATANPRSANPAPPAFPS